MARRKKSSEEPEKLLRGKIVLPEVLDALKETGEPVKVTCRMKENVGVKLVIDFLKKLGIEVHPDPAYHTDRFVFATLKNLKQAQKIDDSYEKKQQCIDRVFLDKEMSECVAESQGTINAAAAKNLFGSQGKDISWAVLDTGIDIGHAWFAGNENCSEERRMDFTGEGFDDVRYHGTHVAGIITSIAPKVKIYDYKVLGRNGGSSSMIIRAMYHIRRINFEAGRTVIHGANLSLGGPVPVGSYGCGWSPECEEANRLMASGVIVCVAAGNDGYKHLAAIDGQGELEIFPTYMDVGISDPGNAEEVITVGSTHRSSPHAYGPSFFSSKGPTGDGRCKPDCVAPGEKIVSARAGGGEIALDGTSMATPHVSGALAVFLSAKPEFKGRALEVKDILLKSCTDLKRDRYFQGAGLVDVLRMIQSI